MPVRGPRGGHGRGRGRGRGKTMIWEWETYKPSPSVYDNIWHIRQAPVTITPNVPNDCPIPDARTRILERRQTEDGFGRNFYFVEITYLGSHEPTSTWVQSSDNSEKGSGSTEMESVDASRILQYVSPRELERFENEQFRIEADAQAVADKEEEEEQVRRRMTKNARMAGSGRGRGGAVLDVLGIDPELRAAGLRRGRPRGRGRRRGRGRGSWRERGDMITGGMRSNELAQDEIVDSEPSQTHLQRASSSGGAIPETSSEFEDDLPEPTSTGLMRSAFVTNSALPLSPVQQHRSTLPVVLRKSHSEVPDISDTDTAAEDDAGSISSAAMQLQFEGEYGDIVSTESDSDNLDDRDGHRSKRSRTESATPQHTLMFPPSSQIELSEGEDSLIPAEPPSTVKARDYDNASPNNHVMHGNGPLSSHTLHFSSDDGVIDDSEEGSEVEDTQEYVVEAINEHYYDDDGKKFYLVKWQGYEDSYDWLPEEDLGGAAELVNEYNDSIKKKEGKARMI